MGYYFKCEYCKRIIPTDLQGDPIEASCEDCGADMCIFCAIAGLCDKCWGLTIDDSEDNIP